MPEKTLEEKISDVLPRNPECNLDKKDECPMCLNKRIELTTKILKMIKEDKEKKPRGIEIVFSEED